VARAEIDYKKQSKALNDKMRMIPVQHRSESSCIIGLSIYIYHDKTKQNGWDIQWI